MSILAKRLSLAAAAILMMTGWAQAEDQLRTPRYRPYIQEVGQPTQINRRRLDKEMVFNSDLRSWIRNYGYPDVAEIQDVVPEYGWSDYEIRVFYFDRNQELAFGRIAFFPRQGDPAFVSDYGLIKYQGPVQAENRQRLQYAARILPCPTGENSLDRILAAAEKAERAALMAEREAQRAADAAARAEAAVARMETGFSKSLRK